MHRFPQAVPLPIQQKQQEIILQSQQTLQPITMQGLTQIPTLLRRQMRLIQLRTAPIAISANQPIPETITGAAPIIIPGIIPEMQTAVMATAIMPTVLTVGQAAAITIRNVFIRAVPMEAKEVIAVAQATAVPAMDIPAEAMQAAAVDSAAVADVLPAAVADLTLAAAVVAVVTAAADIDKSIYFNE